MSMVRITRQLTASNNESLPGILTDSAEIAIAKNAATRGYFVPNKAMTQGLVSSRPWALRSFAHFDEAALTPTAQAPVSGSGYLTFGAGTDNGNLVCADEFIALDYGSGWTMMAVFRAPPDGGGAIVGNRLNQQKSGENSANQRWSGLALGWGTTTNLGEVRVYLTGQASAVTVDPPGANEFRDNKWHVLVGIFDYTTQTLTLRIDGGMETSLDVTPTTGVRDISIIGGAQQIRVAATGLADGPIDYQFHGDIDRIVVAAAPLPMVDIKSWEDSVINRLAIERRA